MAYFHRPNHIQQPGYLIIPALLRFRHNCLTPGQTVIISQPLLFFFNLPVPPILRLSLPKSENLPDSPESPVLPPPHACKSSRHMDNRNTTIQSARLSVQFPPGNPPSPGQTPPIRPPIPPTNQTQHPLRNTPRHGNKSSAGQAYQNQITIFPRRI